MAQNKIIGYKNIFGFTLPDWVDEGTIRTVITFLLSTTAIFFVSIFFIWPKFTEIDKLKVTLKQEQADLEMLKSSKQGFDQLNEKIPESTQKVILSAIPQNYSPEAAIFLLRKLTSETEGMSLVSYKLPGGVLFDSSDGADSLKTGADDSGAVKFVTFPIKLTVSAPVASLLEFINKIETSLPLGVVSDMGMQEVTKMTRTSSDKSIQMDLEVIYYQALLKKVDISKINPITKEDLELVNKLTQFTQISGSDSTSSEVAPVTGGSGGSLFGF